MGAFWGGRTAAEGQKRLGQLGSGPSTPRICELVEYHLEEIDLKGACGAAQAPFRYTPMRLRLSRIYRCLKSYPLPT